MASFCFVDISTSISYRFLFHTLQYFHTALLTSELVRIRGPASDPCATRLALSVSDHSFLDQLGLFLGFPSQLGAPRGRDPLSLDPASDYGIIRFRREGLGTMHGGLSDRRRARVRGNPAQALPCHRPANWLVGAKNRGGSSVFVLGTKRPPVAGASTSGAVQE